MFVHDRRVFVDDPVRAVCDAAHGELRHVGLEAIGADLAERQASVTDLRQEKRRLQAHLARTTNLEALSRQARRIGYVRQGEQLFIVKGIKTWRRAHAATVSIDGRP